MRSLATALFIIPNHSDFVNFFQDVLDGVPGVSQTSTKRDIFDLYIVW